MPVTLSQAIEGYLLDANARRLSQDTILGYTKIFKRFKVYLPTDPPIAGITHLHATEFLASLTTLSNKTLHHYHAALSSLWKWAEREKLASENIIRRIPPPRPEERAIVPYTKDEIKAMLGALDKSRPYARPGKIESVHTIRTAARNRAILLVLVDTGVRASELCTLHIADADLKTRTLAVFGKGAKERIIPISPATGQAIWRYLTERPNEALNHPLFVAAQSGNELNREGLNHLIVGIAERADVHAASVHRFRHTFAITYLRNGGDVYTLQRILGHTTLDMVKRYLSIAQTDVEAAHRQASPVANWRL